MHPPALRGHDGFRDLPPGELKDRFETLARRAGVAIARIRIAGGAAPPARLVGLLSRRPVVDLAEGLLAPGSLEDAEAAFAHEIAHGAAGHPRLLALAAAALILLAFPLGKATTALPAWLGIPVALAVYILLLWGTILLGLLRRFEAEADVAAADLIGAERYAWAVRRVFGSGGVAVVSIRHPAVEARISLVLACRSGDPRREAFLRRGLWIRRAILAGLGASALLAAVTLAAT